jgi:hypothetical protein
MRIRQFVVTIALLAAACASGGGPGANIPKPKLQIIARTNLSEVMPTVASGIDVRYEIVITNNAQIPITLKRIDLDSMAGGGYQLQSRARVFDVAIPAGETRSVDFAAVAFINDANFASASAPVAVRAQALFDSAEGKVSSVAQQRVSIFSGD